MPADDVFRQKRDPGEVIEIADPPGLEPVLVEQARVVRHLAVGKIKVPAQSPELGFAHGLGIQPLAGLELAQERVRRLPLESLVQRKDRAVDDPGVHQFHPASRARSISWAWSAGRSATTWRSSSKTSRPVVSHEWVRACATRASRSHDRSSASTM